MYSAVIQLLLPGISEALLGLACISARDWLGDLACLRMDCLAPRQSTVVVNWPSPNSRAGSQNAFFWPAVQDLGWTMQVQAVALAVGGSFSPLPWHAPMMMMAGSASALVQILKAEQARQMGARAGI